MAHEELLEELDRRRANAPSMGEPKKLAKRKKRGELNAIERLNALADPGSFIETGSLGASGVFKIDEVSTPRDGKVVGFAKIVARDAGLVVTKTQSSKLTALLNTTLGIVKKIRQVSRVIV